MHFITLATGSLLVILAPGCTTQSYARSHVFKRQTRGQKKSSLNASSDSPSLFSFVQRQSHQEQRSPSHYSVRLARRILLKFLVRTWFHWQVFWTHFFHLNSDCCQKLNMCAKRRPKRVWLWPRGSRKEFFDHVWRNTVGCRVWLQGLLVRASERALKDSPHIHPLS